MPEINFEDPSGLIDELTILDTGSTCFNPIVRNYFSRIYKVECPVYIVNAGL